MNLLARTIACAVLMIAITGMLAFPAVDAFGDDKAGQLDGKTLFDQKCLKCHKVEKFKSMQHDRKGWEIILSRMERNKSCILSDAESTAVAEYLSKKYGE